MMEILTVLRRQEAEVLCETDNGIGAKGVNYQLVEK